MAISILIGKIECVIRANSHRGISVRRKRLWKFTDGPCYPVVLGDNYGLVGSATDIRDVCGSVRANFDMTVYATTVSERVHWHGWTKSRSAVDGDRADSINNRLRAVPDAVWIARIQPGRYRLSIGSTTDSLMINTRWRARTDARSKSATVIVSPLHSGTRRRQPHLLRNKSASSVRIGKQDWIAEETR